MAQKKAISQFSLKVGKAEQYLDIDQNETRTRVPFEIMEGDTVLREMNESFPLEASQYEIVATLTRHLELFTKERAQEAESRERQAKLDEAQKVAGDISNLVIE